MILDKIHDLHVGSFRTQRMVTWPTGSTSTEPIWLPVLELRDVIPFQKSLNDEAFLYGIITRPWYTFFGKALGDKVRNDLHAILDTGKRMASEYEDSDTYVTIDPQGVSSYNTARGVQDYYFMPDLGILELSLDSSDFVEVGAPVGVAHKFTGFDK